MNRVRELLVEYSKALSGDYLTEKRATLEKSLAKTERLISILENFPSDPERVSKATDDYWTAFLSAARLPTEAMQRLAVQDAVLPLGALLLRRTNDLADIENWVADLKRRRRASVRRRRAALDDSQPDLMPAAPPLPKLKRQVRLYFEALELLGPGISREAWIKLGRVSRGHSQQSRGKPFNLPLFHLLQDCSHESISVGELVKAMHQYGISRVSQRQEYVRLTSALDRYRPLFNPRASAKDEKCGGP